MPKPKSDKQRAAKSRELKRSQGREPIEVWPHRDDKHKVRAYVDRLNTTRGIA